MGKIGALILDRQTRQRNERFFEQNKWLGFRAILSELEYPYKFCWGSDMDEYDYILCSLTSVNEVENLIYTLKKYPHKRSKIIIGGAGCVNVKLYSEYIDMAVWGRAESQINKIIKGQKFPNVWRKEDDPNFEKKYEFRQCQYLTLHETNVGCKNKCFFCFYSWTHKAYISQKNYHSAVLDAEMREDLWHLLRINSTKRHITALDGFSQNTRRKVNKPTTNKEIQMKLQSWYSLGIKHIQVQIYMIVGYPWEINIDKDIEEFSSNFRLMDKPKKYIDADIFLMITPFSPEPLTPMQYCSVNIETNWRKFFNNRCLYRGVNFRIWVSPYINSPFTLLKRVWINRGNQSEVNDFEKVMFSAKLRALKVEQKMRALKTNKLIPYHLIKEIEPERSSWNYLKTYCKIPKFQKNEDGQSLRTMTLQGKTGGNGAS